MNTKINFFFILFLLTNAMVSCNFFSKEEVFDIVLYQEISKKYLTETYQCTQIVNSREVLAFDISSNLNSRINNFQEYFGNEDTSYIILLKSLVRESAQGKHLISFAQCSMSNRKVLFTAPVYNDDKTKAVVCLRFICGKDCSETTIMLLNFNNKWRVKKENILAVE